MKLFLRAIGVWLVIMVAESVHGTLRRLILEPAIGELRAKQISVVTGSLLILVITLAFIRWLNAKETSTLLLVGLLWVGLTLIFEIALGVFVLGLEGDAIASDFDPRQGGLMGFGLLFMLLAPSISARLRSGSIPQWTT